MSEEKGKESEQLNEIRDMFGKWKEEDEEGTEDVVESTKSRTLTFNSLQFDRDDEYWESMIEEADAATGFIFISRGEEGKGTTAVHSMSAQEVAMALVFLAKSVPRAVILAIPEILKVVEKHGDARIHIGRSSDLKSLIEKLEGGKEKDSDQSLRFIS